jgi:hypothetical protein
MYLIPVYMLTMKLGSIVLNMYCRSKNATIRFLGRNCGSFKRTLTSLYWNCRIGHSESMSILVLKTGTFVLSKESNIELEKSLEPIRLYIDK